MLTNKLAELTRVSLNAGMHRQHQIITSGRLNFSSNDYLSLTSDARIKQAYQHGFKNYPTGSTGSMLVSGYHAVHQDLERAFADALGVDACIIFSSGYAANLSIMSLLAHVNASILIDKAVHASIYDGLKLSKATYSRYLHNDMRSLTLKLKRMSPTAVVFTEGIFSMSGQIAPLADILTLISPFSYPLLVDEAHAFGVCGHEGLGCVVAHGLTQNDVPLRVIPLGKAYAASGAIIAGDGVWIDALLQTARSHIYSTAISPAFAYGLLKTLDIVRASDERRAKLHELIKYFRNSIQKSHLNWRDSHSLIQQLYLKCPHKALLFSAKLAAMGIACMPMRRPTVSDDETGLRVILNYNHEASDIDYLFECLHAI